VVIKVGGIAPLGAILKGTGVNKTKVIRGQNSTYGVKTIKY